MRGADAREVACSVIVPTYGRAGLLPRVVRAWKDRLPDDAACEIVVVDDGSEDDTAAVLETLAREPWRDGTRLRVVRQANRGLAAARNRGIEEARGRVLLFSDDDMVPRSEDFVARHLRAQERRPGAWVGRLVVPDSCVRTPFQAYWRRRLHGGTEAIPEGKDLGKGGFWFATLSIPRRTLGEGRFAEAFTDYGWEEHELGWRLHRRGIRARFLRSAEIEHHDAVDLATTAAKFRSMGRSAWTFAGLHPRLEIAIWTGTHPASRLARALVRQEARGAALAGRDPDALSDSEYRLVLEAAYARGLRDGRRRRERAGRSPGAGAGQGSRRFADEDAR